MLTSCCGHPSCAYPGDVVIASGTLSYLGPFTAEYRTRIADSWVQVCKRKFSLFK